MISTNLDTKQVNPNHSNGKPQNGVPIDLFPEAIERFTVGSLFSGMGGMLGGAVKAGFRAVWASDVAPECCLTLTHRFPDMRVLEKPIQDIGVAEDHLERVDLLMAGFPCQSFSVGGRQLGFEDDRGRAVFQLSRLLSEWGAKRPSMIILENVPNFRHGNNGEWMRYIAHKLRAAGYWFRESYNSRILNTADLTGIPQDRDRLFMVACSTESFKANLFRFPSQVSQLRSMDDYIKRDNPAPSSVYKDPANRFTSMVREDMDETGNHKAIYQIRRYYARSKKRDLCPTLTANMGGGGHNVPFIKDRWGIRQLTVAECATLQGFDDTETIFPDEVSDNAKYRMIGNAVSQPVAQLLASEALRVLKAQVMRNVG